VSFVAVGKPGFLKIKGDGAKLRGKASLDQNKISGEFEVDLSPLTTGIDLRDEHMKEKYLETGKFPTAKLRLDPISYDGVVSTIDTDFSGYLTIKGTEKPISGKFTAQGLLGANVEGTANFEIKMSDFPIGVPSHLGVTVAESVKVSVKIVSNSAGTQHAQNK